MKLLNKTLMMTGAVALMSTGAIAGDYQNKNKTIGDRANNAYQAVKNNTVEAADHVRDQFTTDMEETAEQMRMNGPEITTADFMDVQDALQDKGYNVMVDGVWGPQSTAAIRSFQQQNNIQPTGNLDPRTIVMLGVDIDGSRDII